MRTAARAAARRGASQVRCCAAAAEPTAAKPAAEVTAAKPAADPPAEAPPPPAESAVTWKRAEECKRYMNTDDVFPGGAHGGFWEWTRWIMRQPGTRAKIDESCFSDDPPPYPGNTDARVKDHQVVEWRAKYEKWLAELGRPPQDGHGRIAHRLPYLHPIDHEKYLTEVFDKYTEQERLELGATDRVNGRVGLMSDFFPKTWEDAPPDGIQNVSLNPPRPLVPGCGIYGGTGWFFCNTQGELTQKGCTHPSMVEQ
eukprot:TRINITY_DN18237_c0_g2_i1.p2 TRINITY_DN18237_c0_g2~~TRINITY_DN18237_c0_g2_i1.p2  ORF type:complete len:287 (+),score=82.89 TRINITY_DN18237_c0_g2_i1:97-861(+)